MSTSPKPVIRKRSQHIISRKMIDKDALSVLYRLSNAGFTAYLVGGGVRDLLLGLQPKDFDISTDARPREIRRLFRNAFLIGKRFRLALIKFGDKHIEASTFRRDPELEQQADTEQPGALYQREDNAFGTAAEDAMRRDFTVNALFYDIRTFSIIDYVGGLRDLDRKILRSIGDPNIRFREDPVRMIRALRFSSRLGFRIHRDCIRAIRSHHTEIRQASMPRLFEEILKLFAHGAAAEAFRQLWSRKLMHDILPAASEYIDGAGRRKCPLWELLETLDEQHEDPLASENSLRLATLLYPLYEDRLRSSPVEERHSSVPETLAKDLVQEVVVDPFRSGSWRPPRMLCEDIAAILAAQKRIDDWGTNLPPRPRIVLRPWFPGALLLKTMRTEDPGERSRISAIWTTELEQARTRREKRAGKSKAKQPERKRQAAKGDTGGSSRKRENRRRKPRRRPGDRVQEPAGAQTRSSEDGERK